MSRLDPQALAADVVLLLKTALAPVAERLATVETRLQFKDAELQAFATVMADLTKENAALREHQAVLEVKATQPGPPGPAGKDGIDGKDGAAGMTYHGVFVDGSSYEKGDVVTWAGSMWHCDEATTAKPGEYAGAKSWTMCVKRGRDGKGAT